MSDLFKIFKDIKPETHLKHRCKDTSKESLKIINGMRKAGLPDEVISVVIFYVSRATRKFSHNYAIAIATTMLVVEIKTVEEALSFTDKHYKTGNELRKKIEYQYSKNKSQ